MAFAAIAGAALIGFKRFTLRLFSEPSAGGPARSAASDAARTSENNALAGGSAPEPAPADGNPDTPPEWLAPLRNYPAPDTFSYAGKPLIAEYDPDSLLNDRVEVYLRRYRPETGVILMADLHSGHVLAAGERDDSLISRVPRLAFGSGYPAASLVKILTATAALECRAKELTDSIPQVGRFHTLYRRQLEIDRMRNVNRITLEEAFSRSVNPAFALLGMSVGSDVLRVMAARMGFNKEQRPASVAASRIEIPDSGFSLAETACGFTARTTITPWHALQIARGAGDDGRLRPCQFVDRMVRPSGGAELRPRPDRGEAFISPENLPALQDLMQATVRRGTARKGFHQVMRASHLDRIEAGGKTGSLDGEETPGRFDWFIGYAKLKEDPTAGVAVAVMLVHREYAPIHASAVAALLIRDWLGAKERALRAARAAEPPIASDKAPEAGASAG